MSISLAPGGAPEIQVGIEANNRASVSGRHIDFPDGVDMTNCMVTNAVAPFDPWHIPLEPRT